MLSGAEAVGLSTSPDLARAVLEVARPIRRRRVTLYATIPEDETDVAANESNNELRDPTYVPGDESNNGAENDGGGDDDDDDEEEPEDVDREGDDDEAGAMDEDEENPRASGVKLSREEAKHVRKELAMRPVSFSQYAVVKRKVIPVKTDRAREYIHRLESILPIMRDFQNKRIKYTNQSTHCSSAKLGCGGPVPVYNNLDLRNQLMVRYYYPSNTHLQHLIATPVSIRRHNGKWYGLHKDSTWWIEPSTIQRAMRCTERSRKMNVGSTNVLDVVVVMPKSIWETKSSLQYNAFKNAYKNILEISDRMWGRFERNIHMFEPHNNVPPIARLPNQWGFAPIMGRIGMLRCIGEKELQYMQDSLFLQDALQTLISPVKRKQTPIETRNVSAYMQRKRAKAYKNSIRGSLDSRDGAKREFNGRIEYTSRRNVITCAGIDQHMSQIGIGHMVAGYFLVERMVTAYNLSPINHALRGTLQRNKQVSRVSLRMRTLSDSKVHVPMNVLHRLCPHLLFRVCDSVRSIKRNGGMPMFVERLENSVANIGDVVNKSIGDNEKLLDDRQPSLYEGSMYQGNSRIPRNAPFVNTKNEGNLHRQNGDNDGDTVMEVLIDSVGAIIEGEITMTVYATATKQQTGGSMAGLIQASVDALYLYSLRNVTFTFAQAYHVTRDTKELCATVCALKATRKEWSVGDIVAALVPIGCVYESTRTTWKLRRTSYSEWTVSGLPTKADLGPDWSIWKRIHEDFGAEAAVNCINDAIIVSKRINDMRQQSIDPTSFHLDVADYARGHCELERIAIRDADQVQEFVKQRRERMGALVEELDSLPAGSPILQERIRLERVQCNNDVRRKMMEQITERERFGVQETDAFLQKRQRECTAKYTESYKKHDVARIGHEGAPLLSSLLYRLSLMSNNNNNNNNVQLDNTEDASAVVAYGAYGMSCAGDSLSTMNLGGGRGNKYTTMDGVFQAGAQMPNRTLLQEPNANRVTSFSNKGDRSLEGTGYIASNFYRGLSVQEIAYYSTMAVVKMAESSEAVSDAGTLSKHSNSALNPSVLREDHTVRYLKHQLQQVMYGADGTHPAMIEYVDQPFDLVLIKGGTVNVNDDADCLEALYRAHPNSAVDEDCLRDALSLFRERRHVLESARHLLPGKVDRWDAFCNVDRLVELVRTVGLQPHASVGAPPDMKPTVTLLQQHFRRELAVTDYPAAWDAQVSLTDWQHMVDKVMEFVGRFYEPAMRAAKITRSPTLRLSWYIREVLHPVRMLNRDVVWTVADMMRLYTALILRFLETRVSPGSTVGVWGTLSIGEILVQMQLNAHQNLHAGGVTDKPEVVNVQHIMAVKCTEHRFRLNLPTRRLGTHTHLPGLLRHIPKFGAAHTVVPQRVTLQDAVRVAHLSDLSPPRMRIEVWDSDAIRIGLDAGRYLDAVNVMLPESIVWCAKKERDETGGMYVREYVLKGVDELPHTLSASSHYTSGSMYLRCLVMGALRDSLPISTVRKVDVVRDITRIQALNPFATSQQMVQMQFYLRATTDRQMRAWIARPDVNSREVTTNDSETSFRLFGAEVARRTLFHELRSEIYKTNQIVPSHLQIIVSWMMFGGRPTPINNSGTKTMTCDWLHASTQEYTFQHMSNAADRNERSGLTTYSSRSFMGMMPDSGTHSTNNVIDAQPRSQLRRDLQVQQNKRIAEMELLVRNAITNTAWDQMPPMFAF